MAHAQNRWSTSSNAMTADAEAYQQAQHYGRALVKVRTERAEMGVEDSKTYRALIEEPFTGSFGLRVGLLEWSLKADDKEFTQKLLWWHARVVTGKFLPAEITEMILSALHPQSGSDSDSNLDSDCFP